jgi:hypothetical protein
MPVGHVSIVSAVLAEWGKLLIICNERLIETRYLQVPRVEIAYPNAIVERLASHCEGLEELGGLRSIRLRDRG